MKHIFTKTVFISLLLSTCLAGCRKADQELDALDVAISAAYFPGEVLVGDSLSVSGRLHIDANPVLTLGGVQADYVFKGTSTNTDRNSNTTVTLETVRFKVTADMGLGRQPLEIRVGNQVQVLYVDILARAGLGSSKPDTTLVVEELFRDPSGNVYTFKGRSVTNDGTIYLQTPHTIYRYRNGQLQTLLKQGDQLTINGQQMHIALYDPSSSTGGSTLNTEAISGVAASADNSTLYMSVYTDMNAIVEGQKYTGAWLLLKTDTELNNIEVLNRTLHRVDTTWLLPTLGLRDHYYYPSAILDNGPIENAWLKATRLFVDAQNRLLFNNNDTYYARLEDNGRISTFATNDPVVYVPEGRQAFIIRKGQNGHEVTLYDLEVMEPAVVVPFDHKYNLLSFEESPDWRHPEQSRQFYLGASWDINALQGLPNGELLDMRNPSIGAINPAITSIYTFAGIEKGYSNLSDALVPEQNQLTGPAKYVNFKAFTMEDGFRAGTSTFIGMDNRNNIYFTRGGVGTGTFFTPLRFYRLGKP